ncbi:hypothetical protein BDV29DRAFT_185613 [Aspergillus leporis]|uniref:Uncharacterized protein n=1 Tax=Aspergillus leporis TaxID=41062 RepID=A0A5N5WH35_9EURO|nr:hypothetical protein BDV29DRAFT_185613 [Aspergillus leporis]
MNKYYIKFNCQKAAKNSGKKLNIKLAMKHAQQKLVKLLIISYLPFLFLEHPKFRDLISYARLALLIPEIPSAKVMRWQLRDLVHQK